MRKVTVVADHDTIGKNLMFVLTARLISERDSFTGNIKHGWYFSGVESCEAWPFGTLGVSKTYWSEPFNAALDIFMYENGLTVRSSTMEDADHA